MGKLSASLSASVTILAVEIGTQGLFVFFWAIEIVFDFAACTNWAASASYAAWPSRNQEISKLKESENRIGETCIAARIKVVKLEKI